MNVRAILISLVTGVLAVVLLVLYARRLEVETSGGPTVAIVAAVRPLEPGTILTPELLALKAVPQAYVESRAVKKSDMARIVGLRIGARIKPQQALMWSDFPSTSDGQRPVATTVPPGMRAVSVRANAEEASLLRPGNRVDVFATVTKTGCTAVMEKDREKVAVLVVQNVMILAVGADTGTADILGTRPDKPEESFTLSVSPQQLQLLALAADRGKLTVGVKNDIDVRTLEGVADMPSGILTTPDKVLVLKTGPSRPVPLTPAKD